MTNRFGAVVLSLACGACTAQAPTPPAGSGAAQAPAAAQQVPAPPWPAGDQRGMANALGPATWARCAPILADPAAKVYELSQVRSATMPLSPFAGPYAPTFAPTSGLPGAAQAFNIETLNAGAQPGQQGTQFDALGHFAAIAQPWDPKTPFPADTAVYYGGLTQEDVKPTPDSPLQKLGLEHVPPIVTSAVLLDARQHVGAGKPLDAGVTVTAPQIEQMVTAQGLGSRGILPGDVVYVYTGWSDHWADPDTQKRYYSMAPGLSADAAKYLSDRRIVAISLDAPFIDAVAEGQLAGKAAPPAGAPPGIPFPAHHQFLTQAGIHLVESAKLDELARDRVWTSCTMILPLRDRGAAGSAVRPVAIGVPGR
jgi:kynurenine formamidase